MIDSLKYMLKCTLCFLPFAIMIGWNQSARSTNDRVTFKLTSEDCMEQIELRRVTSEKKERWVHKEKGTVYYATGIVNCKVNGEWQEWMGYEDKHGKKYAQIIPDFYSKFVELKE